MSKLKPKYSNDIEIKQGVYTDPLGNLLVYSKEMGVLKTLVYDKVGTEHVISGEHLIEVLNELDAEYVGSLT